MIERNLVQGAISAFACYVSLVGLISVANAQNMVPTTPWPRHVPVSAEGVDLVTGRFEPRLPSLEAGVGEFPSRITFGVGDSSQNPYVTLIRNGLVDDGIQYNIVNYRGSSFAFYADSDASESKYKDGSTLTLVRTGGSYPVPNAIYGPEIPAGYYIFRTKDGYEVKFPTNPSTNRCSTDTWCASYVVGPMGDFALYEYSTSPSISWLVSLLKIKNSSGYGLSWQYHGNGATVTAQASCVQSVGKRCGSLTARSQRYTTIQRGMSTLITQVDYDNGKSVYLDYVNLTSNNGISINTWVPVSYRYSSTPNESAFVLSWTKAARPDCSGGGLITSDDFVISSYSDAAGKQESYTYFADVEARTDNSVDYYCVYTSTVGSPDAGYSKFRVDGNRRILSFTDGLNNRTEYTYDESGRVFLIRAPEGSEQKYEYDNRSNVVTRITKPKPGSSLPDLMERWGYSVCTDTNWKTCNQPDFAIDARGARTDYSYDPATGAVLGTLAPPDASGGRLLIRYGYTQVWSAPDVIPPTATNSGLITKRASEETCLEPLAHNQEINFAGTCPPGKAITRRFEYIPSTASGRSGAELVGVVTEAEGISYRTCYGYDGSGNQIWRVGPRAKRSTCN